MSYRKLYARTISGINPLCACAATPGGGRGRTESRELCRLRRKLRQISGIENGAKAKPVINALQSRTFDINRIGELDLRVARAIFDIHLSAAFHRHAALLPPLSRIYPDVHAWHIITSRAELSALTTRKAQPSVLVNRAAFEATPMSGFGINVPRGKLHQHHSRGRVPADTFARQMFDLRTGSSPVAPAAVCGPRSAFHDTLWMAN